MFDFHSSLSFLSFKDTKDCILVDSVDIQVDRDIAAVKELGLNLVYGVNTRKSITHVSFGCVQKWELTSFICFLSDAHADHITGTFLLKQKIEGVQSVISEASKAQADVKINSGDRILFGSRYIQARATPGHTEGCLSYVADDESFVLTGDTLLIQGCGRTDFQGGSSDNLYESVHEQLFSLPDSTVVYPAHDHKGRTNSSIRDEKLNNPRLGAGKSKEDFKEIMANLNLSYPKKIDVAVPANMRCGVPDV